MDDLSVSGKPSIAPDPKSKSAVPGHNIEGTAQHGKYSKRRGWNLENKTERDLDFWPKCGYHSVVSCLERKKP